MTTPLNDNNRPEYKRNNPSTGFNGGQPAPEPVNPPVTGDTAPGFHQQEPTYYNQTPQNPTPQYDTVPAPKSKIVAGVLGILLGTLGVHNFYLGYIGKALAQLLITVLSVGFLAWVSGIWGLIEGVLILVSKPGDSWHQDAQGRELSD